MNGKTIGVFTVIVVAVGVFFDVGLGKVTFNLLQPPANFTRSESP